MNAEASYSHRAIPKVIDDAAVRWGRQSAQLQYLYMALAVIAIVAPLAVASFTDVMGETITRALSFVGATAAAVVAGFRLQQKGNEMRKAYFELMSLKLLYESAPTMSETELIEAFRKLATSVVAIAAPEERRPKHK